MCVGGYGIRIPGIFHIQVRFVIAQIQQRRVGIGFGGFIGGAGAQVYLAHLRALRRHVRFDPARRGGGGGLYHQQPSRRALGTARRVDASGRGDHAVGSVQCERRSLRDRQITRHPVRNGVNEVIGAGKCQGAGKKVHVAAGLQRAGSRGATGDKRRRIAHIDFVDGIDLPADHLFLIVKVHDALACHFTPLQVVSAPIGVAVAGDRTYQVS